MTTHTHAAPDPHTMSLTELRAEWSVLTAPTSAAHNPFADPAERAGLPARRTALAFELLRRALLDEGGHQQP